MQLTENTILITGGGSGIGRGLAEAFHALGNQVVIAGRRNEVLAETVAANPGMKFALLEITDGQAIRSFAEKTIRDFPRLNVVIQNAGIMRSEVLQKGRTGGLRRFENGNGIRERISEMSHLVAAAPQ